MTGFTQVGFGDLAQVPDDLFILDPSYQHVITGKRNYGYMWKRFGFSSILLAIFFGIMLAVMFPPFFNELRIVTLPTNMSEGRVIDQRISRGKSTSYYVTYALKVGDRTYEREESVSSSDYYQWQTGSYIPVTYVIGDPSSSHIGGRGFDWSASLPFLFISGFVTVFALIMVVGELPRRRRVHRLRREGQLIFGQLTSVYGTKVTRGSGKSRRVDYDVTLHYQFTNPAQKRLDRNESFTRNDLKNKDLPTRGSVAVLYRSDDDFMVV